MTPEIRVYRAKPIFRITWRQRWRWRINRWRLRRRLGKGGFALLALLEQREQDQFLSGSGTIPPSIPS